MITNIIITGEIGIGKSHIINTSIQYLTNKNIAIDGLRTQPIMKDNKKIGFEIHNFAGIKHIFAHKNFHTDFNFAQYKIDMSVFNKFGVMTLDESRMNAAVIVVDEIGIMEKNASSYKTQLIKCMDSSKLLLAVVQKRAEWFSSLLDNRDDTFILEITEQNRNNVNMLLINKITYYLQNNKFCLDN